jgi:hypothetical protein
VASAAAPAAADSVQQPSSCKHTQVYAHVTHRSKQLWLAGFGNHHPANTQKCEQTSHARVSWFQDGQDSGRCCKGKQILRLRGL